MAPPSGSKPKPTTTWATSSLTTTLPTIAGGTQTDNQSFCYDSLNRLVWAGDTGTPAGEIIVDQHPAAPPRPVISNPSAMMPWIA